MAKRALDADRREIATRVEHAGHAHNRVETQQVKRDRRIVEIHAPAQQCLLQLGRQRIDVDLEPNGKRRLRTDACTDATQARALDRVVQAQRRAPEILVAERVVAERMAALRECLLRVIDDLPIDCRERLALVAVTRGGMTEDGDGDCGRRRDELQTHVHSGFPPALDVRSMAHFVHPPVFLEDAHGPVRDGSSSWQWMLAISTAFPRSAVLPPLARRSRAKIVAACRGRPATLRLNPRGTCTSPARRRTRAASAGMHQEAYPRSRNRAAATGERRARWSKRPG
jgi:hypothetical protein